MDFHLSGSCRYRLAERKPYDLRTTIVELLDRKTDGSVQAVQGSYQSLSASFYVGTPPIQPEPEALGTYVIED